MAAGGIRRERREGERKEGREEEKGRKMNE